MVIHQNGNNHVIVGQILQRLYKILGGEESHCYGRNRVVYSWVRPGDNLRLTLSASGSESGQDYIALDFDSDPGGSWLSDQARSNVVRILQVLFEETSTVYGGELKLTGGGLPVAIGNLNKESGRQETANRIFGSFRSAFRHQEILTGT